MIGLGVSRDSAMRTLYQSKHLASTSVPTPNDFTGAAPASAVPARHSSRGALERGRTPDWIRRVFTVAKKGEVNALRLVPISNSAFRIFQRRESVQWKRLN